MTYSMRLVHLDVGQGTGTFLEVHDTDAKGKKRLVHTALFDFGSDHDTKEAGGPSVEYVVAALKTMAQPTLDAVVLSHSDTDHTSLLKKLLGAFDPYDPEDPEDDQLRVLFSVHGGAHRDYEKRNFNVLDELARYMKDNRRAYRKSRAVAREFSSFEEDDVPPYRTIGPVNLYFLVGNHPNGRAGTEPERKKGVLDAFSLNTVSLVSVLSYAFMQMVETGDATGATLKWANRILRGDNVGEVINDVVGMTVPHHGSSVTMFDFGKASGGSATHEKNLESFLNGIKAWSYTVSAAEANSHRHPDAELLRYFWNRVQDGAGWRDDLIQPYHYYTAFFEAGSFQRRVKKGQKIVAVDWPPKWPDKEKIKTVKPKPTKKNPKPKPEKVKVSVKVKADRLTVRMQRPIYSSVYYAARAADWEYIGVPPSPVEELSKLDLQGGQRRPPLGVAWVYSTVFTSDNNADTSILRETNRKSLIRLRRAMDAGVPPRQLPAVSAEELWPEAGIEPEPVQLPPPVLAGHVPVQHAPSLYGLIRHAPSEHTQPQHVAIHPAARPPAGPRPDTRPSARAAVPSPRSRLRRLEVVR